VVQVLGLKKREPKSRKFSLAFLYWKQVQNCGNHGVDCATFACDTLQSTRNQPNAKSKQQQQQCTFHAQWLNGILDAVEQSTRHCINDGQAASVVVFGSFRSRACRLLPVEVLFESVLVVLKTILCIWSVQILVIVYHIP
jgi:hypothetical protein